MDTKQPLPVAYVDQGDTGTEPASQAAAAGIDLLVVRLPQAKRGFVLLQRRWVVERSFAWLARFRRLGRDDERPFPLKFITRSRITRTAGLRTNAKDGIYSVGLYNDK